MANWTHCPLLYLPAQHWFQAAASHSPVYTQYPATQAASKTHCQQTRDTSNAFAATDQPRMPSYPQLPQVLPTLPSPATSWHQTVSPSQAQSAHSPPDSADCTLPSPALNPSTLRSTPIDHLCFRSSTAPSLSPSERKTLSRQLSTPSQTLFACEFPLSVSTIVDLPPDPHFEATLHSSWEMTETTRSVQLPVPLISVCSLLPKPIFEHRFLPHPLATSMSPKSATHPPSAAHTLGSISAPLDGEQTALAANPPPNLHIFARFPLL